MQKMETLKVQLLPPKAKRVRRTAMRVFGYSKGAISKACNEALDLWMKKHELGEEKIDLKEFEGILKGFGMSSVEAQHWASKKMMGHT